jgi:hypothetical protein
LLAVTVAVAGIAAGPAGAEPIVSLGPLAGRPSAVTDAAGTLHAVSTLERGHADAVGYCRVPAGGTACSTATEIGGFPNAVRNVRILQRPQDGALVVVATGDDAADAHVIFVLVSADGGTTWSAPRIAGAGVFEMAAAALTPDGAAVDVVDEFDVLAFQRVPIAGGVETRVVHLGLDASGSDAQMSQPSIGALPGGQAMVVAYGLNLGTRARVLTGADPYQSASWTPWSAVPRLGVVGTNVRAAFGPNGAWALTMGNPTGPGIRVWRWNGRRFAKPKSLGTIGGRARDNLIGGIGRPDIQTPAFAQDAGGRLHAAWQHYQLCGRKRQCIVYRRDEPRGFGPPVVYPLAAPDARELSIAANAGGSGWIVWSDADGISRAPDHAVPLVTPPRGSRVGSKRIRRRRVTVPAHDGCIPPGGRFVHRLLVSGRRSGVRIVSVRFSFDESQLARVDRHPPFRVVYRLPFAAGTRHVARADVRYRIGRRTRHTSVGRMVVMCP